MLLPRRPPQSRARHHVRAEDITEIAALSHAEVLRPIPARRFLEGSPQTLSGGALSPVPPAVDECVRPSAPCSRCLAPLALLLPVLWLAGGTSAGIGRGSQA